MEEAIARCDENTIGVIGILGSTFDGSYEPIEALHKALDGLQERLPDYVYMPFGGGPRVCIGQHFAMMEAILCLAALHQRWQWEGLPGQPWELSPAVTLRPRHGWRAKVAARARA